MVDIASIREDDVIEKRASYKLIYWGDETPELGTTTGQPFPAGYKIGFMVRAKTEYKESDGKAKKQAHNQCPEINQNQ